MQARPTAAAAGCLTGWWRSARRPSSPAGPPSVSTGFDAMGRRPRPKNLDADLATLAPELRWRAWMGRVEAVIFASKEPVSREVLARVVGPQCNLDLVI